MSEEIELVRRASVVAENRHWSGGDLYDGILEAASCAGLSVCTNWKDPRVQAGDIAVLGVRPWRPASGLARHDPDGAIVDLPLGLNVFHFTIHPAEVRGDGDFAILDEFPTRALDPAVAAGRWATFSQMAEAFVEWEAGHPGLDPRRGP